MTRLIRLVCAICDHLLELVPEPARAKGLADIVDPDDAESPHAAALPALRQAAPASGLRLVTRAPLDRAAS